MKKTNKTTPVEAPAVVHGSSKEAQLDWFKSTANDVKLKFNTVTNGKGHVQRPVDKKKFDANWDGINWTNVESK